MQTINTEQISEKYRNKAIDLVNSKVLVTNFSNTEQEKDLTEPANCNGFGRIRHFKLSAGTDWPQNPLPILPACKSLNLSIENEIRAQVFQNSVCNWRCWYCYVDFKLLNGDSKYASYLTCEELLELYLKENNPPVMIDLSGGQPDLTPEWIPWMMAAIKDKGLEDKIFLWSDDNLSNDYFWKYLTNEQIDLVKNYKMYSRVCCFKGIDKNSFVMNTKADETYFDNQFSLCKRLLELNLDLYCYITLTAKSNTNFSYSVPSFLDKIQDIDELLPLRIVPLKIFDNFRPIASRMNSEYEDMLKGQNLAIEIWNQELNKRFSKFQLEQSITDIQLTKY